MIETKSPQNKEFCQYYYPDLLYFTLPDFRKALSVRKRWWRLKKIIWHMRALGPLAFFKRKLLVIRRKAQGKAEKDRVFPKTQGLLPGDWVEVRSEKDIFHTLGENNKLKGLTFIPEMRKFCGRRYRVYKTLKKIIIEATGELRPVRIPTVILENILCDGSAHGGCDRSCFIFWREAWLKKVEPSSDKM